MKIQHIAMSAGLVAVSFLALSVGTRAGAAPSSQAAVAQAAETPIDRVEPKKFGEHMMIAPVFVTLVKGATDASGETEMQVHIQANDVVRYPVTIEVTTPARDGVLTRGLRTEPLDLSSGASLDRSFTVKAPSGFDATNAFKVVVKGGNNALGFYAEKQYPPPPELKVPARQGPTPPTGRPPYSIQPQGIVPQLFGKPLPIAGGRSTRVGRPLRFLCPAPRAGYRYPSA